MKVTIFPEKLENFKEGNMKKNYASTMQRSGPKSWQQSDVK